ncbi:MAG: hypothetical protein ACK5HM_08280 [Gemmatimonas sp.]|jgi:hypothetical protein|uniref:hypothetical protein n=1 Tax=Gemmatimonas sp. TaxID=1962908 RepID=UPI0022C02C39|nr:hypothetical protein [Gemmatimonas sp.]MCZ8012017.1 hypothetical protein [Gemmatimonas sp.]MCZ8267337.1 hypothetical protein [Gemmatimonas sp.]
MGLLSRVFEDRRLRLVDRLAMWHLYRHVLDWHEFREVRVTLLAPAMRVEDQTVGRAMKELVHRGYLEIEIRPRRLRAYRLPIGEPSETVNCPACVRNGKEASFPPLDPVIPRAVEQALDNPHLTQVQRVAMWYLGRHFLGAGEFRPVKIIALSTFLGVREQTAGRTMRSLVETGYLDVRDADHLHARAYRLPWTRRAPRTAA